ncbi:MAG: TIGR02530 family flagellar biosynthesis protein [Pseudobdellovibrio sp.]
MDKMKMSNPALQNGLDRISNLIPTKPTEIKKPEGTDGTSFKEALGEALKTNEVAAPKLAVTKTDVPQLKFSNHAIERMQSRGITYTPQDLDRLGEAVKKAAAKGSKDTLVLMDHSALIVSVKNNTVVTVMDKNALKENVFTNIDSTIVM